MSSPSEWYSSLPVITRVWLTSAVATAILLRFELIAGSSLVLNWDAIIHRFEVWRLLTNVACFGGPSFGWIINMMMLSKFSMSLELSPYPSGGGPHNGNVADFAWMLAVGAGVLHALSAAMGFPRLLSFALFMMVVYVWSRRHPGEQASFYMFRVEAQYLPWVMLAFNFVLGADPTSDLMGIAAGHLYYFVQEVLPTAESPLKGRRLLQTPAFMYSLFGVPPTHAAAALVRLRAGQGPAPPAPQRQWGEGRVLGRNQ